MGPSWPDSRHLRLARCFAIPSSGVRLELQHGLPSTLVTGTLPVSVSAIEASRLLAGGVSLLVTLVLHSPAARTSLLSKCWAVFEDSTAAQLMGIRPDSMAGDRLGVAAAHRAGGALIAELLLYSCRRSARLSARRLPSTVSLRFCQRAGARWSRDS